MATTLDRGTWAASSTGTQLIFEYGWRQNHVFRDERPAGDVGPLRLVTTIRPLNGWHANIRLDRWANPE